ncbi:1-phosphatidylinositol phosphodiesterase precursor [Melanomma pulvis-pyrius CBS 109.77]|uniref:1-phosphatidylinositol phosphodiesterase n=1 Tax=Melanomma pulvis-pyrius CBS 109.77 TaxID=1314802 RepID=A0A6A6XMP4_9PLEO|nr:1-phosphatidylinositol phosphodiesterase precursor [Melanomma pulvis-pyrius CBS 109.77]
MASPLTVRNLTPTSISLKGIQRFEDPNSLQSKPSAFSFASNTTTSLSPTAPQLGEHAQTFNHQDLDVNLAPFESYTLEPLDPGSDGNDSSPTLATKILRLTIETPQGERYRIDANPTYTQKASHSFTPLTPNPSSSYTALYHPANPTPHLTIHTNHLHNLSKWMSTIPSSLPLSALSIPGTHNSHTYYRALPSVRCQYVGVKTQLENGIRFLDIRVQPSHATETSKKDLYLVHGAFPVSLTGTKYLEPVLQTCYDFLSDNPSETILVSLKREGVGNSTDEQLSQILERHYIAPNAAKWHTNPAIPYLGAVRGKLVLVRRYTLHSDALPSPSLSPRDEDGGYGLDATTWPYNTTNALHGPFCIQDFCEVLHPSSISKKLQYSNEHLVRSAECTAFIPGVNTDVANPLPAGPLYLNFCSGSNFWNVGCWPDRIAKVVNRGLEEWICMGHHLVQPVNSPANPGTTDVVDCAESGGVRRAKDGDGGAGVMVMDCVGEGGDWDLVMLIVGLNMGVLKRVA